MKKNRRFRNSFFVFFSIFFLTIHQLVSAQDAAASLIIAVTKVDTVMLLDTELDSIPGMFTNKAQVVYFRLIKKSGKIKYKCNNIIVTDLLNSDHICVFDFKVGKRYKLPAIQSKYSSISVKKDFRKWHYNTYCWKMPVALE